MDEEAKDEKAHSVAVFLYEQAITEIHKAVLESVMIEVRPLLKELAELVVEKSSAPTVPDRTADALHRSGLRKMEELQKIIDEKIKKNEARFQSLMDRNKFR